MNPQSLLDVLKGGAAVEWDTYGFRLSADLQRNDLDIYRHDGTKWCTDGFYDLTIDGAKAALHELETIKSEYDGTTQ